MWMGSHYFQLSIFVLFGACLYYIFNNHGNHIEFKIVQVQTFFRHGARTPIHHVKSPLTEAQWTPETTKDLPETLIPVKHIDIIDGSPVEKTFDQFYRNKILPGGETVGVLTTQGQKDLYDLGVRMRKVYAGPDGILSDPPKITEIETRSTRVQRNLKSMRSLIAGLTDGHIDGTLEIPSVDYDKEILYPNLKMNNDVEAFYEGTEELQQNVGLRELKEKIKK
ncbi:unnamed protein product, partial [Hymenolepis diminuta]